MCKPHGTGTEKSSFSLLGIAPRKLLFTESSTTTEMNLDGAGKSVLKINTVSCETASLKPLTVILTAEFYSTVAPEPTAKTVNTLSLLPSPVSDGDCVRLVMLNGV